jgi:putative RecB family exonuclease
MTPDTEQERAELPHHYSYSALSQFRSCPKQFYFERILRLPSPGGEAAVLGQFVHKVLELFYHLEPDGRTLDAARSIAGCTWTGFVDTPQFVALDLGPSEQVHFKQRAWTAIAGTLALEPARVRVLSTEERIETRIDGVPFLSIIDRADQTDLGVVITDYKTGNPPSERFRDARLRQLHVYSAVWAAAKAAAPVAVRLLYGSHGIELSEPVSGETVASARSWITKTVETIQRAHASETFAVNPTQLCGYCPFQQRCPVFSTSARPPRRSPSDGLGAAVQQSLLPSVST